MYKNSQKNKYDFNRFSLPLEFIEKIHNYEITLDEASDMLKYLYQTNDKEKNNKLVNMINSGLKDLKEKNKNMSKEERKIENPDKIVKIVKKILKFNKQKQEGQGIKILTPNQMLSRLSISLAQLQAGNN